MPTTPICNPHICRVLLGTVGYCGVQWGTVGWCRVYWTFSKKMQKKSFLTPLGLVRQYNSPKPNCSPSIIIQGNFHLSKQPNERFDRFFTFSYFPFTITSLIKFKITWSIISSVSLQAKSRIQELRWYRFKSLNNDRKKRTPWVFVWKRC